MVNVLTSYDVGVRDINVGGVGGAKELPCESIVYSDSWTLDYY